MKTYRSSLAFAVVLALTVVLVPPVSGPVLVVLASTGPLGVSLARAADAPSGQMTLAHQVSIAP